MTTLLAHLTGLPPRCWDFDPDQLRAMGVRADYDIEVHADAERDWDVRACAEWASLHRLSPEAIANIAAALAERRRAIWRKYSKT